MTKVITFDPKNPLSPCEGENAKNHAAFLDYFGMGAGRSIRNLAEAYRLQQSRQSDSTVTADAISALPPTTDERTLFRWSSTYKWQERIQCEQALEADRTRLEWRTRRQQLAQGAFGKVALALNKVTEADLEKVGLLDALRGMKIVLEQLRAEFNDIPTQPLAHGGADGGALPLLPAILVTEMVVELSPDSVGDDD